MNIYLQELRTARKSILIWTSSLITLAALYLMIYPGIARDADEFIRFLESYPASVRAMLGISAENLASLLGYYSMVFPFVTLFGAIQAMNLGMNLQARETQAGTNDFLLAKPVSRDSIFYAKLWAALSALLATSILYSTVAFLLVNIVKTADYSVRIFFMINMTMLFVQFIFLALSVLASALLHRLKSILPISIGTVLSLFFIGTLFATGKDDFARFLSPFKYFDMRYILQNGKFESLYLFIGAALIIAAIAASDLLYRKRDFRS